MTTPHKALIVAIACIVAAGGCMTGEEWRRLWASRDRGAQPDPNLSPISKSRATRGTIAERVTIDGARLLRVRGFGLVMDLPGTGGSDGPEAVRKHLIKEMRRSERSDSRSDEPPAEVLSDHDTAMVEVTGYVPAAGRKGETFDVHVRALGTQTQSLASGRLVLCNLKPDADTIDTLLGSKTVATARGPVFISPIGLEQEIPEKIDLRTGLVLGGGVVQRPRKMRLVLNDPSPGTARRIENRLNSRYAVGDPIAIGQSHTTVVLDIPDAYHDRKGLFLQIILHTMLNGDPAAMQRRANELAEEITHPDAEFELIGAAWEAIGRNALPAIQELYHHPLPEASFHAARTGLRLGDRTCMEAAARHALDLDGPFCRQAIEELGFAVKLHGAGEHLRKLLNVSDDAVRIRAYKALRRRPHPAIETEILYEDNLALDVVDSAGPYLIYVQRSGVPRIAVFGKQMRCRPPAIYPGDRRDDRFLHTQISALPDSEELTVIFKNKRTGRNSPALSAPLDVPELIRFLGGAPRKNGQGKLEALGVPYDEIVDIVYTFCKLGTIPATFVAEDLTGTTEADLGGTRERGESEF